MRKLRVLLIVSVLMLCLSLTLNGLLSQPTTAKEAPSPTSTMVKPAVKTKRAIAREVLAQAGTSQEYDLYLGNGAEMVTMPSMSAKFVTWIRDYLAREAGWKSVEAKYIARLEANFSEAELQELLKLVKQPLLKKLVNVEMQSYADTSLERRQLLFRAWEKYNSGEVDMPPDILR